MFAIVSTDYLKEYKGSKRKNGELVYEFVERTIPHKGKRYKTYSNALEVAYNLNNKGIIAEVIETLI